MFDALRKSFKSHNYIIYKMTKNKILFIIFFNKKGDNYTYGIAFNEYIIIKAKLLLFFTKKNLNQYLI